jgi:hypothetical protein
VSVTASREARNDRRAAQILTIDAPAYAEPWSPSQDRELLLGQGTLAERSRRLGRTYYAAQRRLFKLRQELNR